MKVVVQTTAGVLSSVVYVFFIPLHKSEVVRMIVRMGQLSISLSSFCRKNAYDFFSFFELLSNVSFTQLWNLIDGT